MLVSMKCHGRQNGLQLLPQGFATFTSRTKDQSASYFTKDWKHLFQEGNLRLMIWKTHDMLLHMFRRSACSTNRYSDRIVHPFSTQSLQLLIECCRRQERLPIRAQTVQDLRHLGCKPELE